MKQVCYLSLTNLLFKNEFSKNSASHFTCLVNPSIKARIGNQLCLYLHSIILSSPFKGEQPKFISLSLSQLETQISSSSQTKNILATIPIPEDLKFPLYLEVLSQSKSLLDLNYVSQFTFSLIYESQLGKELFEDPSLETTVNFSIYEMRKTERNSFTVTCSPHISADLFPQNSAGHFKNRLTPSLNLSRRWKVGVQSVIMPANPHVS